MTRTARIGLAAALLLGGATMAMAQNGPATGGYPPARWNPNLYGYPGYYGYPRRHYAHYPRYYAYYPVWWLATGTIIALAGPGEVTTRSQLVERHTLA